MTPPRSPFSARTALESFGLWFAGGIPSESLETLKCNSKV